MKFRSRDIFNFVFEPNRLGFEQREDIKNHFTKFKVEVDICNSTFIAISNPGVKQIPNHIIELLFDKANKNIQVLNWVENDEERNKHLGLLIPNSEKNIEYDLLTFTNNSNSVTVLIYLSDEERKIAANNSDNIKDNLIIRLLPSNTIINFDNEQNRFDLKKGIEISGVELLV